MIQPGVWEQGAPRESNAKLLLDLRAEMPGERAAEQRLLTLFYVACGVNRVDGVAPIERVVV